MKKLATSFIAIVFIVVACTTTQQKTAFNTIGSIEATATSSVDAYFTMVLKGQCSTNGIPSVSRAYNALQSAARLATDATQFGTNSLAPGNLVTLATDLANTITTAKGQ